MDSPFFMRSTSMSKLGNGSRQWPYANAVYGIADYIAFPIGMLLAAPFLLKHLGTTQYGIWILASSAVSSGGIVAGSFGDAAIKYVGDCRGRQDWPGVIRIVRNMISINLMLGSVFALCLWCAAPYVTSHIIKTNLGLQMACIKALRIGSGLLLVKSIESVFISTLRAFESYGPTVRIAVCSRTAMLISAIWLTAFGHNVVWIMIATLVISILGMLGQALALQRKIGGFSLLPLWQTKTVSAIASFGTFSWIQAMSGIAFGQADRFLVGFLIGAPAVAYYGLCVQAVQPIHGLVSAGMHFIFPHLSARHSIVPLTEIKRKVTMALIGNILLVCVLTLPVILLGKYFFIRWIGFAFTQQPSLILQITACSFALLGMNVTAHYVLLAIGQVRVVTYFNLFAGAIMLLLMVTLIPKQGLQGAALARLAYGPITCMAYFQVYRSIWRKDSHSSIAQQAGYSVVSSTE
jgi:O-antigen/teichoic acid export membrane protein